MAARSFRDRFFTPPVARAIMSPLGIILAGAGAAVGIVAGLPIAAVVGVGAAAWAARVAAAVPRAPKGDRIDPFTLGEPWRRFVSDAQQASRRFERAVHQARTGPLRDHLTEIGSRIETGVEACWRIAQQGEALSNARSQLDSAQTQRELDQVQSEIDGPVDTNSPVHRTIEALQAQLASGQRMDKVITDTRDRLRLLDARLDEAVARALELSVQATSVDDLSDLTNDVDGVVGEMEALRQGLEEADQQGPQPATG
jgi:hypothetical protein